jgi:hypothetical protein
MTMSAKPMDAASFMLEIKRRTANRDSSRDPLFKAIEILAGIAPTAEGQALKRVLDALATREGSFRESDVYLFSSGTLALVATLMEARLADRYRESEWQLVFED